MNGKVTSDREAVVRLQVLGRSRNRKSIKAVIDTGYTGSLSLPPSIINSLRLPLLGKRSAELADGSLVTFRYYLGKVNWNGRSRDIEVDESPSDPLIGMMLLEGSDLHVRVRNGGSVTILPIP